MLRLLNRIAVILSPLRYFILLVSLFSLGAVVSIIFNQSVDTDVYLPALITLFGWSCCLFGIVSWFTELPEHHSWQHGFFTRQRLRIKRSLAWLLGLLFTLCSTGLLYLTYSSVRLSLIS
ncbi:hypothetical protein DRW07_08270 [Alteromonas sediminis]|uniref:Uncharacterized protein n=1 Tax=Alteromonas sediminis TaxID=2259342 RepID=A0A3N5Y8N6_9ALTE|nr:hypothetical protein [Alteromonas sediminis]RPJ67499.1 hypothetical protein DRW07_08270 [Alteromonas sediminis]